MKPLLIILLWIVVIVLKSYIDYYQIEKQKKNIRHGFELLLVAIVAFFHQWLSGVNKIEEWELAGTILIFQLSSFYLLFDLSLNLMRGKEIMYVGQTSAIDKFMWKYPAIHLGTKLFCLVFVVWSVIELYNG